MRVMIQSLLVVVACAATAQTLSREVVARPVPRTVLLVSVGEAGTGAFIADAEVRLPSVRRTVRTKWDGEARFDGLDAGPYQVQVRALGFAPGDIDIQVKGDSLEIHFDLERIPSALDTVRVAAEETKRDLHMEPFETRRREGIGRFLTRPELLDDRTKSLQWVLSTHFAGFQIKEKGIISRQPSGITRDNECPVLVYLDGMQLESVKTAPPKLVDPRAGGGGGRGRGESIVGTPDPDARRIADLEIIRPEELAGVEVYTRTTAPQQYRPIGNYCHVVLLWTYFPRSKR